MRRRFLAIPLAGLALAVGATGCDSPPCGMRSCDIRDPSCQRMAAAAAACLRGESPLAVPTRVITVDRYVAEAAASSSSTPERDLAYRRWTRGLSLLGLAPGELGLSDDAAITAANLGAYYQDPTAGVTVLDHGTAMDWIGYVALLIHEYTHALQDRTLGLDGFFTQHITDFDSQLAVSSVIEGEATQVEDLALLAMFGTDVANVPWPTVFSRWQVNARENSRLSPTPVALAWNFFRYPFGTELVNRAWRQQGWAGVDVLEQTPPSSTRQVLAGADAPLPADGAWRDDLTGETVPVLPPQFSLLGVERMGAWVFDTFLRRHVTAGALVDASAGLTGDSYSWHQDSATGGVTVIWKLRFATVDLASRVANVLADAGAVERPWVTEAADRDVIFLADTAGWWREQSLGQVLPLFQWTVPPPAMTPAATTNVGVGGHDARAMCARPAALDW